MGQYSKVLLAIDKVYTIPQNALDFRLGLGGLNHIYGPNCPTPKYITIFTRCTNR